MDKVDKETRSRMMSSVRDRDTMLEIEVRRRLFAKGFRFRLHRNDLPGKPDIVFSRFSAVIFLHGCFWHQHWCERSKLPATRQDWWKAKLEDNKRRDIRSTNILRELGWRVMVIWECSVRAPGVVKTKALDKIANQAAKFLNSGKSYMEIPANSASLDVRAQ